MMPAYKVNNGKADTGIRSGNRKLGHTDRVGRTLAWEKQDRRNEGAQLSFKIHQQVKKLTPSQNLDSLSNLRIISIQSNRLTKITGLSALPKLEELYLSHNAITDLSGLESNETLRVLDFSNNQVSHLEYLSSLKNLEELWGSNNQLASFEEVERELKDKEKLETVYFEGNPLQLNGPAVYRNKVRLALPNIKQIDASKSLVSLSVPLL